MVGAALAAGIAVIITAGSTPAAAGPDREIIIHGFRAPSMGVELKQGWLGLHVGAYPTTIDDGAVGEPRTTWFAKTGLTAYVLERDLGAGRPSALYVGVALVQGLGNAWDVAESAADGSGVFFDAGARWAVYRGLDLRLGVGVLVGNQGRIEVNPTPGISWTVPL